MSGKLNGLEVEDSVWLEATLASFGDRDASVMLGKLMWQLTYRRLDKRAVYGALDQWQHAVGEKGTYSVVRVRDIVAKRFGSAELQIVDVGVPALKLGATG